MIATNPKVILKIDQSDSTANVELISLGPIGGNNNKLTGVRIWHRVPFFYNLEWFNFKYISVGTGSSAFIEISDAGKLIKFLNSMTKIVDSCGFNDFGTPEINFLIEENELKLKNDKEN